ncbi:citrate synthase active site [Lucifera butyrica]|uniref:Citrate synthase n=1 Tax=Lucifera butyrica TaxID=1351585 RepID=A0A498R4E8_9FIRM|nr:citrate/2-methylcitrate synthase [Lucifera butyrica]VBB05152.1 citrate synthase active site [Lucifera butyrica]
MAGLADIVACESSICSIENSELRYRGYSIDDLAQNATFEEIIYLLWYGRLPNRLELKALKQDLAENAVLPKKIYELLHLYAPWGNAMAKLRTCLSFLTHFDDEVMDHSFAADHRKAVRIMARIAAIVAAIDRIRKGLEPIELKTIRPTSLAEMFLWLLTGEKPAPIAAKALDTCFVLHAEHELNASTFAARVTVSTMSDIYSGIVSAIGTLKGPLHGNANEQVARMLEEIGELSRVEEYIAQKIANGERIMGFGHRVYKNGDPRAKYLQALSGELAEWRDDRRWYELSLKIEKLVYEQKGLKPNVDFYSASVYTYLEIPRDLFTLMFAISRTSGWLAHILEQHENNRIIRPRAEYSGKTEVKWKGISER